MKTSALLALTGALLAMASPIKRDIEIDIVTDIIYVTVTVDAEMSTPPAPPPAPTTMSTSAPSSVIERSTTSSPEEEATSTVEAAASVTVEAAASVSAAAEVFVTVSASAEVDVSASTSTQVAVTVTASASTSATDAFTSAALYHHNVHRSNHSAADVTYNDDLASYAATVAAKCVFAHDLTPGSSKMSYGQNIAMWGSSDATSSDDVTTMVSQAITDMWYNGEVTLYPSSNYGTDSPDMGDFDSWGHFTQVVWAATTEIGCAVQFCEAGTMTTLPSFFTVCNYFSAGNVEGEYGDNVLVSLGEASVTA